MVKPQVTWIEPLLVQPAPTRGLEYDPEARTLELYFDFDSPRREVFLAPRDQGVSVGVLDLTDERPGVCPDCRKSIVKAVGFVTLAWPEHIRCEPCFWAYHARHYYGDAESLQRVEARRAADAKRQAREIRQREEEYRAKMGLRPVAVAGGRGRR